MHDDTDTSAAHAELTAAASPPVGAEDAAEAVTVAGDRRDGGADADRARARAVLAAQRALAKSAAERVRSELCLAYVRAIGHHDVRDRDATHERRQAGYRRVAMARIAYRAAGGRPAPTHYEDLLTDDERAEAATPHPVIAAFRANRYADAILLAAGAGYLPTVAVTGAAET